MSDTFSLCRVYILGTSGERYCTDSIKFDDKTSAQVYANSLRAKGAICEVYTIKFPTL